MRACAFPADQSQDLVGEEAQLVICHSYGS
jgi:hypothetical protein